MAAVTTKRKTSIATEHITTERIAARAYELFLQRGGVNGSDVQDWLAAESELIAAVNVAPKRRVAKAAAAMVTESLSTSKKVTPKKTTKKATAKTTTSATTTRRKTKTSSADDKKK